MIEALLSHARDLDADRPKLVGVYFLMRGADVFYIGQSTDLEHRVRVHRADPRMREVDRVFWIPVQANDLDATEGAFLRALRPTGNTKRAPGNPDDDVAVLARFGIVLPPRASRAAVPRSRKFAALGAFIKSQRITIGLKQYELAAKLGVHLSAVSHWEKGWTRPDRDRTAALADVLGVPVADLEVSP